EQTLGHTGDPVTQQDVANPGQTPGAGSTEETMQALTWQGKDKLEVRRVPKPTILEPRDVILRVTGSTVCGSDLHRKHGSIVEPHKGDILGHEFCGVVDAV